MAKRILVVEDDAVLARVLRDNLTIDGFEVESAANADEAIERSNASSIDLILLDLMLPGLSGFDLGKTLGKGGEIPIIILSARGQKADKLRGLTMGADDYVTKPFDMEELVARIHNVLRRKSPSVESIHLGSLSVDFRARRARDAGRDVHLTHREFEILRFLAERRDRIVHRDELLREIWGFLGTAATRSVDQAIARLRKKIEPDAHTPRFLLTVHGDGYLLALERGEDERRK
jgi:two-component system, OmpR family, response regulator VicR